MSKRTIFLIFIVLIVSFLTFGFFFWFQNGKSAEKIIGVSLTPTSSPKTLTLEKIFADDHSQTASLSAQNLITIIATGDVIPARSVNYQTIKYNDFHWAFEKTADFLKNADLTVINLESPLIPNCPIVNDGMTFCGDERHIKGLTFAGIDVATLENNHTDNYGNAGIENTIKILNDAGIKAVRENSPQTVDIKGTKFAFLAYHDLVNPQNNTVSTVEEKIANDIKQAKKSADVVIVAFHWGVEYTEQPTERQRMLAHLAIDSGADLILGNHPHQIEPVEIYKNKLIVYAHGNFVFDQMWSEETKKGVVGRYTFSDGKLVDAQFFPVYIKDYGQPYFLEGEEKEKILSQMKSTSLQLSSTP